MSKQHVLIVEDEPDIADLIRFHCEREGMSAETIGAGKPAVDAIRKSPPDLVILDLMLPDVGGIEICRRLKQWPETREIPVVMVTAKGEESDIVTGLEIGADDYVIKPFSPSELIARIRAVLRRARPSGADEMRRAVREQVKGGADLIKIMACHDTLEFTDEELAAVIDESHRNGIPITETAVHLAVPAPLGGRGQGRTAAK